MKRVLITGATGFIGSHLARSLIPEARVFGLFREPLNVEYVEEFEAQLTWLPYDGSYESVEQALQVSRPDMVYHLATYYTGKHSGQETPKLLQSNVILGAYLLEAMASSRCTRLVYTTSVMEHYKGAAYRPLNLYAATKRAFSDLMDYYIDSGLLRAATLVLTDTYGPDDRRPKILNLIREAVHTNAQIALSTGTQDYDIVYIDDVVQALLLAGRHLEREEGCLNRSFQVCSDGVCSLRETVELMLQVNGLTLDAVWGARPPAEREMKQAVRVYPTVPEWTQQVSLEEGLRRFWREGESLR